MGLISIGFALIFVCLATFFFPFPFFFFSFFVFPGFVGILGGLTLFENFRDFLTTAPALEGDVERNTRGLLDLTVFCVLFYEPFVWVEFPEPRPPMCVGSFLSRK